MKFRNLPKVPQEAFTYFKHGDLVRIKDTRFTGIVTGAKLQFNGGGDNIKYDCFIDLKCSGHTQTHSWKKVLKIGKATVIEREPESIRGQFWTQFDENIIYTQDNSSVATYRTFNLGQNQSVQFLSNNGIIRNEVAPDDVD